MNVLGSSCGVVAPPLKHSRRSYSTSLVLCQPLGVRFSQSTEIAPHLHKISFRDSSEMPSQEIPGSHMFAQISTFLRIIWAA